MGSDAPGARRRGRNEGSIYKDEAKGRWYGAVSLGYGPDGQTWRRHKVSGRTRVEVAEKLKQLQAERDSGVQPERAYTVQRAVDAASRLGPSPWSPRRPSRQQASAG
jgi:hypothetical protein